jgi:phage terminase large subunit-like protein
VPLDLSCPDWFDRLKTGRSIVPTVDVNPAEGERAVRAFDLLRLADVPGTPTLRDACGDWFRDIVRALFASTDPVTKERLIRDLFVLVPKKNSKTSYSALLMLVALILFRRPHGQMFLAAPVQDVADLAFAQASGAVDLDPELRKLIHVRESEKTLINRNTKATLEIVTFDPAVLTGRKPVAFLIDEVHVIAKLPKAASALRQIRGGMLPFPEAFLAMITTQSEEAPVGIMRSELNKARAIRDGRASGAMLPVLYEFPEKVQKEKDGRFWRDPANWHMVTPNEGRSITVPRLEQGFEEAKKDGEAEIRAWASQHLNIEIGLALHSDSWAGAEHWEAAAEDGLTLDDLLARSDVVTAGIDGGGLDDLLALSFVGRDAKTKDWLAWSRAWCFEGVLTRRMSEASRLRDMETDGDLSIIKMLGQDVVELVGWVSRVQKTGKLAKVGVDPAGIGAIVDALAEIKITAADERLVGIPQGWRLNGPILTAERKLADGTLRHGGQALMAWAVGNAKIVMSGNAVTITKQAAGRAKIDPLMSMLNAIALMSRNPEPPKTKIKQGFVLV